jgi:PII-like signaling protein
MNPPVKMLIIYVDESDTWGEAHTPLYEALVRRLRQLGIGGATVHSGIMGFGSHQKVHHRRLFGISDDKPAVITSVENEAKLRAALPEIRRMAPEAVIVLVDAEFIA